MVERLKIESSFGRYRIIEKIGEGGMGEVYLADDTRLERKVALKVLPAEIAKNSDRMERFVREAKAASSLNHPNIAHIYDIGDVDGVNYISMEYVEGHTLRDEFRQKGVDIRRLLKYLIQVAEGLAKAHAAGIVHRDLKPENMMISRDGYAKILDFGLAKLLEGTGTHDGGGEAETAILQSPLSTPGMILGTAGYMSPEQAKGKKDIDQRSDIFSFGCVLYEAVTGKQPFAADSVVESLHKIINDSPRPIAEIDASLPADLARVLRRCLAKDPEERFQTIKDAAIELREIRRDMKSDALDRSVTPSADEANATAIISGADSSGFRDSAGTRSIEPGTSISSAEYVIGEVRKHKFVSIGVLATLAAALMIGGYFLFFGKRAAAFDSIAVLPFVNASGDQETDFLSDGIAETLINNFTKIPALRVTARSTAFRYKGKETDPQTIGKELNVGAILTGKVLQRGDTLSIQVDLIDTSNGSQIWGNRYSGKTSEILNVQQSIARDVSEQLKLKLSGVQEQQIAKNYTANPEAYQFYLRGRFYWNKRTAENLKKAIEQFQAALDKDPNYALAFVGLADCYAVMENYAGTPASEALPQAKAFATRALAIDDSLAEAHVSLAFINNQLWDWADAEKEFKRAIAMNPNYPTAHHWYSLSLNDVGRFDESAAEIRRAQELDPVSNIINQNVTLSYLAKNDYKSAIENSRRMIELDPNFGNTWAYLGQAYLMQGSNSEAIAAMERAVELTSRAGQTLGELGYGYAVAGRRDNALAIIRELEGKYAKRETIGQYIAAVYAGLGDKDAAFAWLEKDFQARSGLLARIRTRPGFAPLRDDPRLKDILRRMGLPE